jgi:hypothetical protein
LVPQKALHSVKLIPLPSVLLTHWFYLHSYLASSIQLAEQISLETPVVDLTQAPASHLKRSADGVQLAEQISLETPVADATQIPLSHLYLSPVGPGGVGLPPGKVEPMSPNLMSE